MRIQTGLSGFTAPGPASCLPIASFHGRVAHHFVVCGGLMVRFERFTETAKVRDAMTGGSAV